MLERGIPSILICSEEFSPLGRAEARAYGYEDLPILEVPHPFGVLPQQEVLSLAREKADEILRQPRQTKEA